ncbi:MAG: hypothetical protein AAGI24_01455 [Pseudomonadota bacterium]
MNELVTRIEKAELCYVFADNALRRGRRDLAIEAYRHAVDLRAAEHVDVTEDERLALKAFYAYEEALSYGERRRKCATGTWQLVKKHGILEALKKRLASRSVDDMDARLKKLDMQDYSIRAVALRLGIVLEEVA